MEPQLWSCLHHQVSKNKLLVSLILPRSSPQDVCGSASILLLKFPSALFRGPPAGTDLHIFSIPFFCSRLILTLLSSLLSCPSFSFLSWTVQPLHVLPLEFSIKALSPRLTCIILQCKGLLHTCKLLSLLHQVSYSAEPPRSNDLLLSFQSTRLNFAALSPSPQNLISSLALSPCLPLRGSFLHPDPSLSTVKPCFILRSSLFRLGAQDPPGSRRT